MGFVDYLRMGMGWWSSVPPALGSLSIERVSVRPSLTVDSKNNQSLGIGDFEVTPTELTIDRVEIK